MPNQWIRERKNDGFYKMAKKENYRSRSAFKLIQINEKFKLIKMGDTIIDLGAAPGGWSQVALDLVGPSGLVIAIDIVRMPELKNVNFIQADIRDETIESQIKQIITDNEKTSRVASVISDMAPNTTGNISMDHARSIELAEYALEISKKLLAPGGSMLVKLYDGEDFISYREEVKKEFKTFNAYKPIASIKKSKEAQSKFYTWTK